MKLIFKIILICLILFLLGFVTGYFLGFSVEQNNLNKKLNSIKPIRESNSSYKFIDPLLAYIIPSADQQSELANLKNKIYNLIKDKKSLNLIDDSAVFFYDLNRGRWIGINESEKYNPASMLKVVVMVSYFKELEKDKNLFEKN